MNYNAGILGQASSGCEGLGTNNLQAWAASCGNPIRAHGQALQSRWHTVFHRIRRKLKEALAPFKRHPPVGWVRFGSLRRLQPVSRKFGYDRGTPISRYYIETFLKARKNDIRGRVVEI